MTDDIFATYMKNTTPESRKAVRYSLNRVNASITLKKLFRSRKHIDIEIINISSKGSRISAKYKFSKKGKIIFNITITNICVWEVPAKIVRIYGSSEFGVVFDSVQHDLVDQIIENDVDFTVA